MTDEILKRAALNIINIKKNFDSLPKIKTYKLNSKINLKHLTLDDLAFQFAEIDRQSYLLKGQVLLEVKRRLPSDKEFGKWVSTHRLNVRSQQFRNQLMHLAEFFRDGRDMTGIGITAAYSISAPQNHKKALTVYEQAHGKNLSVKEVNALLAKDKVKQDEKDVLKEERKKTSDEMYEEDIQRFATKLINIVLKGKLDNFKLDVFEKATELLKKGN